MLCSANNNNNVKFIKDEGLKFKKLWVFRILRKQKFIIFTIFWKIIVFLLMSAWANWNIKLLNFKIFLSVKLFLTHLSISMHEKMYLSFLYPTPLHLSLLYGSRNWSNIFEFFHTKENIVFTLLWKLKMRRVGSDHQTILLK